MGFKPKKIFSWNSLALIISIIAMLLMFSNYFSINVYPLDVANHFSKSLDLSWKAALNFANFNNLTWGKDFVFTYGPLSPLALRTTWGENLIEFVLFDIFYAANIFCVVFLSLKNHKNKVLSIVTLIVLVLIFPGHKGGDYAIIYFFTLVFWIFQSLEKPKIYYFVFQILCVLLLFYLKFNTGLIALVIFYISLLFLVYSKNISIIRFSIFTVVPALLILFLAKILNVDLINYAYYGLEMVKGYNEIMYINTSSFSSKLLWALLFAIFSISLLVLRLYYQKIKYLKIVLISALYILSLYILYKQSFVRDDSQHIISFFSLCVFLVFCTHYFFQNKAFSKLNLMFIPLLIIPLTKRDNIVNNIESLTLYKNIYFKQLDQFNSEFGFSLKNSKNILPDKVLKEIGNKTVDIYPWDVLLLLENNLNYLPRPVIQSYTAYTKELENLNFELYNSKNGPEYVIYHYKSIDNRYPYFDESKLNLALQYNYEPMFKFNFSQEELILFKRKTNFKPIKLIFKDEYAIELGAAFVPKENYFYEVELYPNISGKLYSIAKNSPEIRLDILDNEFKKNEYKISNSLLKSGIYSNIYFNTVDDIFYNFKEDTTYQNNYVKAYYFTPKNKEYFKDRIRIKTYKIEQ